MTAIVRHRVTEHYTILPNASLRDARLSFRARGVLAYGLSLPDGARLTVETVADAGPEGREAIRAAMQELEQAGYLVRRTVRDAGGRLAGVSTLYDVPLDRRPAESEGPVPPAETPENSRSHRPPSSGRTVDRATKEVPRNEELEELGAPACERNLADDLDAGRGYPSRKRTRNRAVDAVFRRRQVPASMRPRAYAAAGELLDAGWEPEELIECMVAAPTLTVPAIEVERAKRQEAAGDTDGARVERIAETLRRRREEGIR